MVVVSVKCGFDIVVMVCGIGVKEERKSAGAGRAL
jgi:hypothetical protein